MSWKDNKKRKIMIDTSLVLVFSPSDWRGACLPQALKVQRGEKKCSHPGASLGGTEEGHGHPREGIGR